MEEFDILQWLELNYLSFANFAKLCGHTNTIYHTKWSRSLSFICFMTKECHPKLYPGTHWVLPKWPSDRVLLQHSSLLVNFRAFTSDPLSNPRGIFRQTKWHIWVFFQYPSPPQANQYALSGLWKCQYTAHTWASAFGLPGKLEIRWARGNFRMPGTRIPAQALHLLENFQKCVRIILAETVQKTLPVH